MTAGLSGIETDSRGHPGQPRVGQGPAADAVNGHGIVQGDDLGPGWDEFEDHFRGRARSAAQVDHGWAPAMDGRRRRAEPPRFEHTFPRVLLHGHRADQGVCVVDTVRDVA